MNRTDAAGESPSPSDLALKRALQQAAAEAGASTVGALTTRVMADWRREHAAPAPQRAGAALVFLGRSHRVWAGAAGVAAIVAIATAVVASRPDPALDELMQPDVLSQLAVGEM